MVFSVPKRYLFQDPVSTPSPIVSKDNLLSTCERSETHGSEVGAVFVPDQVLFTRGPFETWLQTDFLSTKFLGWGWGSKSDPHFLGVNRFPGPFFTLTHANLGVHGSLSDVNQHS